MIEYDKTTEEMMVFCDEPGCDGQEFLTGSWKDCIYELKQMGWKITHKDGEFIHSCPLHRVDFIE